MPFVLRRQQHAPERAPPISRGEVLVRLSGSCLVEVGVNRSKERAMMREMTRQVCQRRPPNLPRSRTGYRPTVGTSIRLHGGS